MDINEKDVERYLVTLSHKNKILTFKLVSPNQSGVPDRIVIAPDGALYFVELKRPGQQPRPLQQSVFAKLRNYGHPVYVIDNKDIAKRFIDDIVLKRRP